MPVEAPLRVPSTLNLPRQHTLLVQGLAQSAKLSCPTRTASSHFRLATINDFAIDQSKNGGLYSPHAALALRRLTSNAANKRRLHFTTFSLSLRFLGCLSFLGLRL